VAPGVLAKLVATADHLSNGRAAVNVVSGWFKGEFTALGEPWLEHDERYRRSEEFIRSLRGAWTEDHFQFSGDFYRFRGYNLEAQAGAAHGRRSSRAATGRRPRAMAARVSDWYFMNGNSIDGVRAQVEEVSGKRARSGGGVPVRAERLHHRARHRGGGPGRPAGDHRQADVEAVHGFGEAVKQAGKAAPEREGMWAQSNFDDLVQYNDGFKSGLIGTPEQIARRIVAYKAAGVNLILGGFLHYLEDVEQFGRRCCRWCASWRPISASRRSGRPEANGNERASRSTHRHVIGTTVADPARRLAAHARARGAARRSRTSGAALASPRLARSADEVTALATGWPSSASGTATRCRSRGRAGAPRRPGRARAQVLGATALAADAAGSARCWRSFLGTRTRVGDRFAFADDDPTSRGFARLTRRALVAIVHGETLGGGGTRARGFGPTISCEAPARGSPSKERPAPPALRMQRRRPACGRPVGRGTCE
jgi:alkanesulfonate monooxygenase SsuD/methylene tetrahydromethanopterin reductase-like flavin-dependent oxidoreductase (luciferase family)